MKGFVVSVLALAVGVALVAPREDGASKAPVAGAASADDADSGANGGWGGEMVLDREGDGHFYADVSVDSRDYRMLVDTGATVVALTGDDARDMGLDWDPNALAPIAQGAGGPVMGVAVTIPRMAVGDFEARNVRALIVPEGLGVSLLGQSFLTHVPKVDISGDALTLSS